MALAAVLTVIFKAGSVARAVGGRILGGLRGAGRKVKRIQIGGGSGFSSGVSGGGLEFSGGRGGTLSTSVSGGGSRGSVQGFIDLDKRMRNISDIVFENAGILLRDVGFGVTQELVFATPVDTGLARSNWLIGVNAVPTSIQSAVSSGAATAQAAATLAFVKAGDVVYIANNVPYIWLLNAGSSRQAPAGYIITAVLKGSQIVRVSAQQILDGI